MRLSVVEGLFFALMTGFGENYFVAHAATRAHATPLQLGFVTTLPLCAGALGALASLRAMPLVGRRKPLLVGVLAGQTLALWALAALDRAGALTATRIIAGVCVYQLFGQAAGTVWGSWFGDLVPESIRGRYFARRNRGVYVACFLGLVAAGLVLQRYEAREGGGGYHVVFGLAGTFRAMSAALVALSPEPRYQRLEGAMKFRRFLATERGGNAWRLLATGAGFQLLVYLASPYFGPFLLRELRLAPGEYMVAQASVVTAKFLTLPAWGRTVDRYGARQVFRLAVVLCALVPIPWLWTHGLAWAAVCQLFSGAVWGAYEVAFFTLVLESTYKQTRPMIFALQSVFNGSMQLCGGLVGAQLLAGTPLGYRALFAVSAIGRLVVALTLPRLIRHFGAVPPIGRRQLLLRVIGLRPHGGVVHRPLPESPPR